jgi:hypothetical protein
MAYISLAEPTTNPTQAPASVTDSIKITVKSYIAPIGSRIGSVPCSSILSPPVPIVIPTPIPGIPVAPIPSTQQRLAALAAVTDATYSENPPHDRMDKGYRLFTQCAFQVTCQGGRPTTVTASPLATDVGMEGPITPPPLIVSRVVVGKDAHGFTFAWTAKGRPHPMVEPPFTAVCPRTSVYIWHTVSGRVDCRGPRPRVTMLTLRGSQFPSHRAFVNGLIHTTIPQGVFSNLWVPTPGDTTRVR